jgi:hypothetical protein
MAKARTVPHSPPADHPNLAAVCRDLDEWPRNWMGFPEDIPPGEQIVAAFRPFLAHLVGLQLSRNTLRKHVDNLWLLGGELIRDVNSTPALRKRPIAALLFEAVEEGGRCCITGTRRRSNAPLTLPAASSAVSWSSNPISPSSHPQIPVGIHNRNQSTGAI